MPIQRRPIKKVIVPLPTELALIRHHSPSCECTEERLDNYDLWFEEGSKHFGKCLYQAVDDLRKPLTWSPVEVTNVEYKDLQYIEELQQRIEKLENENEELREELDEEEEICPHCKRNEDECEKNAEGAKNPITYWMCGWGLSCDDCYYNNHPSEDSDEDEDEEGNIACESCDEVININKDEIYILNRNGEKETLTICECCFADDELIEDYKEAGWTCDDFKSHTESKPEGVLRTKPHTAETSTQTDERKIEIDCQACDEIINVTTDDIYILDKCEESLKLCASCFDDLSDVYKKDGWTCDDFEFPTPPTPPPPPDLVLRTSTSLVIEVYSPKSFVVRGNTKEYKDKLKSLGGKWNANLTDKSTGSRFGGWIFSNNKRKIVEEEL